MTDKGLEFLLRLTDYFHGHWEDPEWGRRPAAQLLIALAIREYASGIQDKAIQAQIIKSADTVIAKNGQAMTK